ncbi:MAG: DinB family protein [Terriglobia bacterium]
MPMHYPSISIPDVEVPKAHSPQFQHLLDIYVSETNKVASVWRTFVSTDLAFKPHARSSTVLEIMKHQLLSERRFFGEFLGTREPNPAQILPEQELLDEYAHRLVDLALPRLRFLAERDEAWWLGRVRFFDVEREKIWIFWRRILHTAHHRTQLTVYLRLLGKEVPSTYGPTADVSWEGADPTQSIEAAGRR